MTCADCGAPDDQGCRRGCASLVAARVKGTVETLHRISGRYGGCYGVIYAEDGKRYVWSAGNVFRNGSALDEVGASVTFEVAAWSYATNIDRTDKA